MRAAIIMAAIALAGAGLVVAAPQAEAAAICTAGDIYNTGGAPCHGVVCYGYSQNNWQYCVLPYPTPPPQP